MIFLLENIKHRIFPATKQTKESEGYLRQIDIDKLEPIMVRREFSEKDIIKLANSICKSGVLFPIPVYTDGKTYKYISGSRRIAACMLLGRKSIICHVYTSTETRDKLMIASIMHEKTPNPFDIYSLICYFQDNQLLSFGEIAEKLGTIVESTNLYRTYDNPSQTHKNYTERQQNVKNIFALHNPTLFENKTILLIDDVFTTGSTIIDCCRALNQSTNINIHIFTVAAAHIY